MRLSDVEDVTPFVGKIVAAILPRNDPLFDEAVGMGLLLAVEKWNELGKPDSGLAAALSGWLELRIRDGLRRERKQPVPDEVSPSAKALWHVEGDMERQTESKLALMALQGPADIHNPRLIGRVLFGTPSHRPPGTHASEELWPDVEAERQGFKL